MVFRAMARSKSICSLQGLDPNLSRLCSDDIRWRAGKIRSKERILLCRYLVFLKKRPDFRQMAESGRFLFPLSVYNGGHITFVITIINMKNYITYGLLAIVIVGGGVYLYRDMQGRGEAVSEGSEDAQDTPKEEKVPHEAGGEDIITVNTGVGTLPPDAPDLDRPVKALIAVNPATEENSRREITRLTAALKEDSSSMDTWLILGIYRKALGDYKAAEEIWRYVAKRWPKEVTAYNNLGDLYKDYLKDYPKAEEAFKSAIAMRVDYISGYANLSDLYRFFMKDKQSEAPKILKQGLSSNPENIELMLRLARYYAEVGPDIATAKVYFAAAIDASNRAGKTDFAASLKAEMDTLK